MDITEPIDMHVHLVGNGLAGSGCWLRLKPWQRPFAGLMSRQIGLRISLNDPAWDRVYPAHLAGLLRESSVAGALVLAQDAVYDANGERQTEAGSFYVPNEFVFEVCRQYPEFLPACSIHPARPDAMEELERCLENGAVAMKCLPNCHNIDCNDRRYRRFWQRMADAGLPLLAHTGGEHTVPVIEPRYADPRVLRQPLECGVKVIAAHCATKSGLLDPEYFFVLLEMFQEHPNLYGDTSAFNVPLRGRHVRRCLSPDVAERLVHGSDFPVPVSGYWRWMQGLMSTQDLRRCQNIRNVIERDYQLKVACGFGPEHFTRIHSLLRRPARVAPGRAEAAPNREMRDEQPPEGSRFLPKRGDS